MEENAAGFRDIDNPIRNTDVTIACFTEYKVYTFNEKQDVWALVSMKAPHYEENEDDKRAPIDVVVVVDKSGSMAGKKLKLLKKTLEFVLTQLNKMDRFSIVTYDTNVYVDYELQNMSEDNKKDALTKIQNITDGTCTNLCGGLLKGLCQIIDRDDGKNDVASVLLFTDGLANAGITNSTGIVQAMKDPKRLDGPSSASQPFQQRHSGGGVQQLYQTNTTQISQAEESPTESVNINDSTKAADATVYTFGFGDDHDPDMLKEISDAGNGMYYYIENEDKIAESFGHCMGGLLSTVAQGIQLNIVTENGVLIKEVHTAKAYTISDDKKSVKINIGDLQSEESRDIVLELTLESVSTPLEDPPQLVFNASVDYFNVTAVSLENKVDQLSVIRTENAVAREASDANPRVGKEKARIKMTKAMKESKQAADRGDLRSARAVLTAEIENLRLVQANFEGRRAVENDEAQEDVRGAYGDMLNDLVACSNHLSDERQWRSRGNKLTANLMQQHQAQRSSNAESTSYVTQSKSRKVFDARSFLTEEEQKRKK